MVFFLGDLVVSVCECCIEEGVSDAGQQAGQGQRAAESRITPPWLFARLVLWSTAVMLDGENTVSRRDPFFCFGGDVGRGAAARKTLVRSTRRWEKQAVCGII